MLMEAAHLLRLRLRVSVAARGRVVKVGR